MSFGRPDLVPFIALLPLLLALAVWLHARRRRRIAAAFSEPHLLARLGGEDLTRFPLRRLVLVTLAGAALATAAAGPRWGLQPAQGRAMSLNVVIAADISRSMLAEDVQPNRLERARLFARQLLRELPGDRFGLVVFAGRAYVLSPLTVDHSALELYLDALDPAMVSQGGSTISAAIAQATDLVRGSETVGGDRVVVLLTDGEALEEEEGVYAAADRAARAGVKVITVGIGTPAGARIPDIDPSSGLTAGWRRDEYGEIVVSRLDEALLQRVANRTGGSFVRLDEPGALRRLAADLGGLQRGEGDDTTRLEPRERHAIFTLIGVLLLALDALFAAAARAGTARGGLRTPMRAPVRASDDAGPDGSPSRRARRERRLRKARLARRLRGTRAAVVVFATSLALGLGIGDLERGNRMYREGRFEEAVEAYQRVIEGGSAAPQVHYNLGTALLALGRFTEAESHFQAALQGVDPELRQRTFYNTGNRFLEDARGQADLERQGALLDAAIEAYRRALRMAPDDVQAKWNLELALRDREENEQQQMQMPQQSDDEQEDDSEQQQDAEGSGGSGTPEQPEAGDGSDRGTTMEQQPMSQEQADRILSAIEQDERELTREKLRRGQRSTPVLRDW